jgi:hypothetical protein
MGYERFKFLPLSQTCEDTDKTRSILSLRSHPAALKSGEQKIYNTRFGFMQDKVGCSDLGLQRPPAP